MDEFTQKIYESLIGAARQQTLFELFDTGNALQVENLMTDMPVMYVGLDRANRAANRKVCRKLVDKLNSWSIAEDPTKLEAEILSLLQQFVRINDTRTLH